MAFELIIAALGLNATFFHDNYVISKMNKVNCMGDQDSCFVFHQASENLFEDHLANISIQS